MLGCPNIIAAKPGTGRMAPADEALGAATYHADPG